MSDEPKYLFRVQHDSSHSTYIDGVGVVATHHIPGGEIDSEALLKQLKDDTCSSNRGRLRNSVDDLLRHSKFRNKIPTSCVSTSSSLEFAMFWSQYQHQCWYRHTGIRVLVIDVPEIKRQGLTYWEAGPSLRLVRDKSAGNFAIAFEEWIVEVYIPVSAIVQEISRETIESCRPVWYSPSSVFGRGFSQFDEWKMRTSERRKNFSTQLQQARAIGFILVLANHKKDGMMTDFAKYAYGQLFREDEFSLAKYANISLSIAYSHLTSGCGRLIWSLVQYSLEKKVLPKYSDILLVFQLSLRLISGLRIIAWQKVDVEIDSTSSHTTSSGPNGIFVICLSMSFVAHLEFIAGQVHPELVSDSDISGLENKFKRISIGRYLSFPPPENVFRSNCFSSYSHDTN